MRTKYRLSILIVALMIIFSLAAEAQNPKLLFNGQEISSESIKIIKGRTLISARFISEKFGDEIEWDNKDKKLKINSNGVGVVLEINNRIALIDNKPMPLDAKPRLIDGQVMVPLRFLTRLYGGKLSWDANTKSINYTTNRLNNISVKTFHRNSKVVIDLDSLTKYDLNLYHQPTRLVLDINNVSLNKIKNLIPINSTMIKQVRVSQYKFDPAIVRIAVDINSMSSYHIVEDQSRLILNIQNNSQVITSSIISDVNDLKKEFDLSKRKIVIDAGHGGHDPGAIGVMGLQEKQVNYQIAKKVEALLKEKGFNTMMTRDNDYFISLSKRAERANRINADIFVSIHANSNARASANGTATYGHWDASKDNWALAWYVQSEIIKRTGLQDNGLKAANFAVLRQTDMPAILIETAFLSNPSEEKLLASKEFQQRSAEGIVAGIEKYYENKKEN
ncbi:N-acetylmuramoyl-L-alanine amidase family protein [Orenia marismortui]|uniref:N-acetylmuramoyl-L-alanine amidase family protein n=1 Tax=Orenia marismortui TaxID=46469 RepID=UPI000376A32B|nr:N-acetylmuramoyl-L-alanine amidase family protein [Orenia marismortui]